MSKSSSFVTKYQLIVLDKYDIILLGGAMYSIKIPKKVNTDYNGFSSIISLLDECPTHKNDEITLDFSSNIWFEANLFAVLGCILSQAPQRNGIYFSNIGSKLTNVMRKNGFGVKLNSEIFKPIPDKFNTVIPYIAVKCKSNDDFTLLLSGLLEKFVYEKILNRSEMTLVKDNTKKQIASSFGEIFVNCVQHGDSFAKIFLCGQLFPNLKKLNICIVNTGKTISDNVESHFALKNISLDSLKYQNYIDWAVQYGSTTKECSTGGLGLYEIRSFIQKNHGQMHICSGKEYWQINNQGNVITSELKSNFYGTVVNLEFNINDSTEFSCDKIDVNSIL